jgi:hypothetical protein
MEMESAEMSAWDLLSCWDRHGWTEGERAKMTAGKERQSGYLGEEEILTDWL